MSKSEKYQRFSEECLEIARTVKDDQSKAVLMYMAQVWSRLAEKKGDCRSTGLILVWPIGLICQFIPSFCHFF
jgi:hypothetical protein